MDVIEGVSGAKSLGLGSTDYLVIAGDQAQKEAVSTQVSGEGQSSRLAPGFRDVALYDGTAIQVIVRHRSAAIIDDYLRERWIKLQTVHVIAMSLLLLFGKCFPFCGQRQFRTRRFADLYAS
jgi:hypothetical protein